MSTYLPAELRQQLVEADDHRSRQHVWTDHFAWDAAGIRLIGLTAIGRTTIIALNINNEVIVDARRRWVGVGWHPPAL